MDAGLSAGRYGSGGCPTRLPASRSSRRAPEPASLLRARRCSNYRLGGNADCSGDRLGPSGVENQPGTSNDGASASDTHQRPHTGGSARGRAGLEWAQLLIVRGRAIYLSRLTAWACWADGRHSGNHFAERGIVLNVTSSGCDPIVPGILGLLSRSFVFGTGHAPCSRSRNIRMTNTLIWKEVRI